jgi:L-lactate dehydrogenase complex protein LldF
MAVYLPKDGRAWATRRDRALANPVLRRNLAEVTRRLATARVTAYREYPRAEALRVQARSRKRETIRHLDTHLAALEAALTQRGAQVVRAAGADAVAAYVLQVAARRGGRRVVKSKSMVTEELDLNARLEAHGLAVRETDLGEYIIQLAGERPSHILIPAAHRNRAEIRTLFAREAEAGDGPPPASDAVGDLAGFARARLREEFLRADIGITGANFLVAETGTVVLVTNEGNADMVSSLPPVHIVVAGIEKVVATWEDLAAIIQQPAMSGIGQRLSAYTTLISGPREPGQVEGPEELHVILVDNGRRGLLGTAYEDVLSCIRCGACYNVCPVYRQVGGHAYGTVYGGPIGAVETPLLAGLRFMPELPQALCTLCNACVEACPMDIDLPHHFITLRRTEVDAHIESWGKRFTYTVWGRLWATPAGYRRLVRWARRTQAPMMRSGRLTRAPGLLGGWFKTRDMPPVAAETFHEWWARREASVEAERGDGV